MTKKHRKSIKPTAGAVIAYLILSVGLWSFMYSYSVSESRISGTRTSPAGFGSDDDGVYLRIGREEYSVSLSALSGDNDAWLAVYLLMPDELRQGIWGLLNLMP